MKTSTQNKLFLKKQLPLTYLFRQILHAFKNKHLKK